MSARSGGFIAIQGTANAKTWPVEDMIRARSTEQGAASGECDQDARNGTRGQAAARGQFALFGKGRALARWYQRHGARSKGQGADGARRRIIRHGESVRWRIGYRFSDVQTTRLSLQAITPIRGQRAESSNQ